jgi:chorismate synthase
MSIEKDSAYITAGLMNGLTTGAPIALTLREPRLQELEGKRY